MYVIKAVLVCGDVKHMEIHSYHESLKEALKKAHKLKKNSSSDWDYFTEKI